MPLIDLLSAGRVAIVSGSRDRAAVIETAARLLATPASDDATPEGVATPASELIGDSLHAREQLASTAIGHGVAIPHGRLDSIDDSRGAFLRLAEPVDFGAADGIPVDLVMAMVVPLHSNMKHLEQLAELAEYFSDPAFRLRLREAGDTLELTRCLLAAPACPSVA
ncbi:MULTISPECIES: PTS sugar transporter subunit IIA [Lysobacteraceae]|uniref:PTS sugar transporter subunit IIA n=1 Tax=Novilysobacter avium TaxID=2781023 RepID=A0A7S6ULY2_9GAMM|nr:MULTISPECIES: PTS sugar transporter subunit IIA [Lysobacter]QOW22748.1 PTS sugar transporter subunit IIA [Lysobacter avium]QOW25258.1 PTS sugar transporter subunit IIA [Lysobacter sp. H23M47]